MTDLFKVRVRSHDPRRTTITSHIVRAVDAADAIATARTDLRDTVVSVSVWR
jgi:hypothetical protein